MTNTPQNPAEFFFGIMVLNKDGKWKAHSKVDGGAFGSALIKAEEVDAMPEFEGVKVMKIPTNTSSGLEPKEVWISPRFEARAKAQADAKVRQGMKQTQEHLEAARRDRFKK
ncbi:MAG: hypothetical protein OEW37_09675 [Rhodospirillaceae bacterium]|nr:hypothetical protein [Rhodospirillaceae bacterium]